MSETGNPIVEYRNLIEAEDAVGFELLFPAILRPDFKRISVIDNKILEVLLPFDMVYRMARGAEDISGIHQNFPEVWESLDSSYKLTEKGASGRVHVATWIHGQFTFSFYSPGSISHGEISQMVTCMKQIGRFRPGNVTFSAEAEED